MCIQCFYYYKIEMIMLKQFFNIYKLFICAVPQHGSRYNLWKQL